MTPINIARHPSIFCVSKTWFKSIQPAIAAKTDSIDKIIAAGAGLAFCWAIIWRVYPMPAEKIPVYKISNHSICILESFGSSHIKARIIDKTKTIKYWILPNKKGLFSSFIKISIQIICKAKNKAAINNNVLNTSK